MSERNGHLPPGWILARLPQVAALNPPLDRCFLDDQSPVTFVPMSAVDEEHGGLNRPQLRPLAEVKKGYTNFLTGDVLFAKITPCMENGKVCVVPPLPNDVGYGSTEFHVLRPQPGIEAAWVSRFMGRESFRRLARSRMTGSAGQMRVPTSFLEEVEIPVPPTPEQVRILEKIDELFSDLDKGVALLKRVRLNLDRYRASVLKSAVIGKLTAEWRRSHPDAEPAAELLKRILQERRRRWEAAQLVKFEQAKRQPPKGWKERHEEPEPPQAEGLPALPENWCWTSVDQLLLLGNYGTSVKCDYAAKGLPVLRIPNISRSEIDLDDLKFATTELTENEDERLSVGDLLVCRTNGSLDLIGKAALVRQSFDRPHHFASYLIRLRFVEPALAPFIHRVFCSALGRRYIERHAASSAGQHNVSLTVLRRMPIPLSSLGEVAEIEEAVSRSMSVTAAVADAIQKDEVRAESLRQSILRRAFSGQLVPHDPLEEPISLAGPDSGGANRPHQSERRRKTRTVDAPLFSGSER